MIWRSLSCKLLEYSSAAFSLERDAGSSIFISLVSTGPSVCLLSDDSQDLCSELLIIEDLDGTLDLLD